MKLLIVVPNDSLGGAEQFLKLLSEYFLQAEVIVYVVFFKQKRSGAWSDLENFQNFTPIYSQVDKEILGLPFVIIKLFSLRNLAFDYIITSHVHTTGIVGIFRKLNIVKTNYFIGRESTLIFERFKGIRLLIYKILYNFGYPSLDLLICQSELMKSQLKEALPSLGKKIKIEVIPNPIDLKKIRHQQILSESNTFPTPYIVSAGRLIPEKGFDLLIDSFSLLKKEFPALQLLILGEGPLRKNLEFQIAELKLKECVNMPGFVTNVYPYFRNAEVCVVSSRIEGFPNVLLQMMSQNNKVVSTLCAGGISDLKGVLKAPTNDVQQLYKSICTAIKKPCDNNRILFDTELENRSIENFVQKVDTHLNVK